MGEEDVKNVVRSLIRGEVDAAFTELKKELSEQLQRIDQSLKVIETLGTSEEVRERLEFINLFIEREKERARLRKAVIEKSLIGAVWVLLGFFALSGWRYIVQLIREALQ